MDGLVLTSGRWWGWQEMPVRHAGWGASPIFVTDVAPLKTGKGVLRLGFLQALHPVSPARRTLDLRIILHTPTHFIGRFQDEGGQHCSGVVSIADFDWISSHCQLLWERRPPEVPSLLINGVPLEGPNVNEYLCGTLGSEVEGIVSGATVSSWGREMPSMPERTAVIYLNTTFSPFNSWLIARGFIPKQMEDKWFIYFEAGRLKFRRSWSGILIYDVEAQWRGDQLYLGQTVVNRSAAEYGETDDEYDKQIVQFLVEAILLGLPAQFPVKPELTAEEGAIHA